MEMHLASEVDIIREWTVQVFTTMLKRVPDKNYTEPLLKRIILDRLRMNHLEGKSDDSERLIWSLKLLLNHTKELKLQDKLVMRNCKQRNTFLDCTSSSSESNCSNHR